MSSLNAPVILKAIIIDDELHGRENLNKILEIYCPEVEVLGCADGVVSAIELVANHQPEVVFLDINMPVLNGFDFLDEFDQHDFLVVFVSAHMEFGIKALKAGASDYLLKPINIKELKQTIKKLQAIKSERIKREVYQKTDQLILPATHGFDVLVFDELIRLEAEGCYTKIFIKNGKSKLISRTMKAFEDTLPKDKFFRVHKSHLINLSCIKEFSNLGGTYVTMTDGSKVEISRRKAPDLMLKLKAVLNSV